MDSDQPPSDPGVDRALDRIAAAADPLAVAIAELAAYLRAGPVEMTPDQAERFVDIMSAPGMLGAAVLVVDLGRTARRESRAD